MATDRRHRRYLLTLLGLFLLIWGALAIDPLNRHDWLLENLLVAGLAAVLLLGHKHYLPSRSAATLIFLYLCIHRLGAHYTYANVPYNDWWQALSGEGLNEQLGWERNQFDRLAHFSYGLLLAYPMRELLVRRGLRPGFWSLILPIDIALSTSAIYELIEWFGAEMLGGGLGRTFLATQNDRRDPQKDMPWQPAARWSPWSLPESSAEHGAGMATRPDDDCHRSHGRAASPSRSGEPDGSGSVVMPIRRRYH